MNSLTPRIVLDELSSRSLAAFTERTFLPLNPGQTFQPGHHLRVLAYHLELVREGKIQRLAIAMPPRHSKSVCASVAFPAWLLGHDPSTRIICASYAADLSHSFSLQTRKIMEQPWYRHLFPRTRLDPRRTSQEEMRTTQHGFRIATSVGGPLTGKGGSIIIVDDPIKAADAHFESARRGVREWYQSTLLSRLDNPKRDAIVVVGQRLHPDDLHGLLIEQEDWVFLDLPAIATETRTYRIGPEHEWEREVGHILQPDRVGRAELERLRRELGTAAFEAQYQQRPVPPEGNLVKLEWFQRYDEPPHFDCFEAIVQSWDTALIPGEGNDYSVCTTWGLLGTRIYLLDVFREQLNYPDLRRTVLRMRKEVAAELVIVEKAGSGVSLYQELHGQGHNWIRTLTPRGDKAGRLAQQSAKIEAGLLWLPRNAKWLGTFESELAAFPHGSNDDQVDSLSQFLLALDYQPTEIRSVAYYRSGA
ncbi:MAG: phage terminase large subunit [Alphaproteobacteria bacterium]